MASELRVVKKVFDGCVDESVSIPLKFFRDGVWVESEPDGLVAVVGNPLFEIPRNSLFWNIHQGCIGWMRTYLGQGDGFVENMNYGTVYLVEKEWYDGVSV